MSPIVTLILAVVGLVFAVVWLLLPFALFGIKPRLDQQIAELREIRRALDKLAPPAIPTSKECKRCHFLMPTPADTCPHCGVAQREWGYKAPIRGAE